MLNRKKWRKSLEYQSKKQQSVQYLIEQFRKINNNLSDQFCIFIIANLTQQIENDTIIQVYMKPLQGVFEHTEFRIKLYLPSSYYKQRPHAFNDRQIYHPNINIKTCEIVFPQIVKEWGAASDALDLLRQLKYVIIEANTEFVPNNRFNRKAAWDYYFDKIHYKQRMLQILKLPNDYDSNDLDDKQQLYWSLSSMTKRKKIQFGSSTTQVTSDGQIIDLLTKKIKILDFNMPTNE